MRSIISFLMITSSFLFSASVLCKDNTVSSKPVILMLFVKSDTLATLQETLKNELAIELVNHAILSQFMPLVSPNGSLANIEDIRQMAVTADVEAVIWLEQTKENKVTLNLLAATTDRSTLRSIGAELSGKDIAGELAIAARLLLEEIHINLKAAPVNRQESNASPPIQSETVHHQGRQTLLSLHTVTAGSFEGTTQSPILFGGGIAIGLHRQTGLYAVFSFDAFANPSSIVSNGTLRTYGFRPGVGVGYYWGNGPVNFGPYLGIQVPWQTASVAIGLNPQSKDSWWNFRAVPSLDLRISLSHNVFFSLTPGLGILVNREVFERASDRVIIYKSPYIEWNIVCAVIITLTKKQRKLLPSQSEYSTAEEVALNPVKEGYAGDLLILSKPGRKINGVPF